MAARKMALRHHLPQLPPPPRCFFDRTFFKSVLFTPQALEGISYAMTQFHSKSKSSSFRGLILSDHLVDIWVGGGTLQKPLLKTGIWHSLGKKLEIKVCGENGGGRDGISQAGFCFLWLLVAVGG